MGVVICTQRHATPARSGRRYQVCDVCGECPECAAALVGPEEAAALDLGRIKLRCDVCCGPLVACRPTHATALREHIAEARQRARATPPGGRRRPLAAALLALALGAGGCGDTVQDLFFTGAPAPCRETCAANGLEVARLDVDPADGRTTGCQCEQP